MSLVLLALAVPAGAQTHPCDGVPPTTQTVSSSRPGTAQVCVAPTLQPEALTVYINGQDTGQKPLTLKQGPNTQGLALYEGPSDLVFTRGATVTLQVTVWNRPFPGAALVEGPKSSPLECTGADDVPPAAAKFLGIRR